jgi:hypothetical protein
LCLPLFFREKEGENLLSGKHLDCGGLWLLSFKKRERE